MKKYFSLVLITFLLTAALPAQASSPTVIINEVAWMGTTTNSNDEWIELFNSGDAPVDLTNWRLRATDGSPDILLTGSIPAGGFFLIERTDDETIPGVAADVIYSGSLSNTGEQLQLVDATDHVIDEINATTDGWLGGDNITKQTLERKPDAVWKTFLDGGGTPMLIFSAGAAPATPPDETDDTGNDDTNNQPQATTTPITSNTPATPAPKNAIVITEILPNPTGAEETDEFIELKNTSGSNVDITSWVLKNASGKTYTIPSITMSPNSVVVFFRSETKLPLRNTSTETVTLTTDKGTSVNQIKLALPAPDGQSYAKSGTTWHWTDAPTPGENNPVKTESPAPVAVVTAPTQADPGEHITFDATDSFSNTTQPLTFHWDFGDGRLTTGKTVRQVYTRPGTFTVQLTASDGKTKTTTHHTIHILGQVEPAEVSDEDVEAIIAELITPTTTENTEAQSEFEIPAAVMLSELYPNPPGSDSAEFIELFNLEPRAASLAGWQIRDASNRTFTIPDGTMIGPSSYLAFSQTKTKISLNNTGDTVTLVTPQGEIVDQAEYTSSDEGASWVRDELGSWQTSTTPTPGELNALNSIADEQLDATTTTTASSSDLQKILGAEFQEDEPLAKRSALQYGIVAVSIIALIGAGVIWKIRAGA
jgi:hypothetical protein